MPVSVLLYLETPRVFRKAETAKWFCKKQSAHRQLVEREKLLLCGGAALLQCGGTDVIARRLAEQLLFDLFDLGLKKRDLLFRLAQTAFSGTLFGEYGFWRSADHGKSWARINTDAQMFGGIVSMDGDMRQKGRVYIATGTRGGLYGDEMTN